jgi:hypothetical protein
VWRVWCVSRRRTRQGDQQCTRIVAVQGKQLLATRGMKGACRTWPAARRRPPRARACARACGSRPPARTPDHACGCPCCVTRGEGGVRPGVVQRGCTHRQQRPASPAACRRSPSTCTRPPFAPSGPSCWSSAAAGPCRWTAPCRAPRAQLPRGRQQRPPPAVRTHARPPHARAAHRGCAPVRGAACAEHPRQAHAMRMPAGSCRLTETVSPWRPNCCCCCCCCAASESACCSLATLCRSFSSCRFMARFCTFFGGRMRAQDTRGPGTGVSRPCMLAAGYGSEARRT